MVVKYKVPIRRRMRVVLSIVRACERRCRSRLCSQLFVGLIIAYQYLLAPLLVACCRFHPCCSDYAKEAIIKHGVVRGLWLGIKRIGRCHPWGNSGYDSVP